MKASVVARNCVSRQGFRDAGFSRASSGNIRSVFGLHVIAYNLIRLGNLLKPVEALPKGSGISSAAKQIREQSHQSAPDNDWQMS